MIFSTAMIRRAMIASVFAALLAAWPVPSSATGDLFSFWAQDGDASYTIQLVGRQDPGMLQVHWPGIPGEAWHGAGIDYVEFDRPGRRLVLDFKSTDEAALPSFRLTVDGDDGSLETGGRRIIGEADWMIY